MAEDFTDPRQAAHIRNLSPKKLGKNGVDLDNEIQELRTRLDSQGDEISVLAFRIKALEQAALAASNQAAVSPKPAIVATGGKK